MSTFPKAFIAAVAFLLIALLGSFVLAGTTVTERQGSHELRRRDQTAFLCPAFGNTPATTGTVCTRPTHADCLAAIPTPTTSVLQEWTCKEVTHIHVQANCDDVPMPPDSPTFSHIPNLRGELCPGSDQRWRLIVRTPVRDNSLFPVCWEMRDEETFSCNEPPDFILPPPYVWDIPPDPVTP